MRKLSSILSKKVLVGCTAVWMLSMLGSCAAKKSKEKDTNNPNNTPSDPVPTDPSPKDSGVPTDPSPKDSGGTTPLNTGKHYVGFCQETTEGHSPATFTQKRTNEYNAAQLLTKSEYRYTTDGVEHRNVESYKYDDQNRLLEYSLAVDDNQKECRVRQYRADGSFQETQYNTCGGTATAVTCGREIKDNQERLIEKSFDQNCSGKLDGLGDYQIKHTYTQESPGRTKEIIVSQFYNQADFVGTLVWDDLTKEIYSLDEAYQKCDSKEDASGRIIEQTCTHRDSVKRSTYEYDANGYTVTDVRIPDSGVQVKRTSDKAGNRLRQELIRNGVKSYSITYGYDCWR